MANPESNALEISVLKNQIAELLSKSKQPKDIESTTSIDESGFVIIQNTGQNVQGITIRNLFFEMLKSLGMVEVNSEGDMTGATLFGTPIGARAGINDGKLILGWKSTVANPTSDTDFETPYGLGQ